MKPYLLYRCRAHSTSVCWIVRRWQATTGSYVYESSFSLPAATAHKRPIGERP